MVGYIAGRALLGPPPNLPLFSLHLHRTTSLSATLLLHAARGELPGNCSPPHWKKAIPTSCSASDTHLAGRCSSALRWHTHETRRLSCRQRT